MRYSSKKCSPLSKCRDTAAITREWSSGWMAFSHASRVRGNSPEE